MGSPYLRAAGSMIVVVLGAATIAVAGKSRDVDGGDAVHLPRGERVVVMQARDYFAGSLIVEGTGAALVQSVHNALAGLGLSPQPGSYAAVVNALEECRRLGCAYVVLPELKRYTPRTALRSKVRVSLELYEATAGRMVASCDATETGWRHKGEQVQELMRPAVEACLDDLVAVESAAAHSTPAPGAGGILVVPYRDLWVLPREEAPQRDDRLVDLLLESLRRADREGERGASGAERREVFLQARTMQCNRILGVGVGLVWTDLEEPPEKAPPQLVVTLIDVASERNLQTVVAQTGDARWMEAGSGRLQVLMDAAVGRLLRQPAAETIPPDGVTLSLLEPATIVEDFDPVIPRSLRRRPPAGTVEVRIVVDEQGRVANSRIVESVPELDRIALRAARRLRFLPARRDGEVCPIHMTIRYRLDGD